MSECSCVNMAPRMLRGVTRTVRITVLDKAGNAVDLSVAREVVVTVSLDGAGASFAHTPRFTVAGDDNNIVEFPWYADEQKRCGRYTIDVNADFGNRNQSRVDFHREFGVELVEHSCDVSEEPAEAMEVDDDLDLEGTLEVTTDGMSAFDQWRTSPESEGYPPTEEGFFAWMRQPATDAATAAAAQMSVIQGRADEDHTRAGNDHTRAESDHGTASSDHTRAASDHSLAELDHIAAGQDHTQAVSDHTRAEADHGIAADDHTQATADHAVMAGYDTRLGNVESEVSQLGQELHKDSLVALTPQKLYGRYCNSSNKVVASSAGGGKAFNAAYFPARSEAWAANVVANNVTASVATGTIALVDSLDEIAVDATVNPVVNGHPAGTYSMNETVVVPAGKILVVFEINYSANIFYYNEFIEGDIAQLETNDKSCIVSAINEVRSGIYEDVLEAITPTKIYGRRLTPITGSASGLIAETSAGGGTAFNIAYFPARSAEWNAKIYAEKIESSISIGAMAFVDSVDSLAVGEWINPFIPAHSSNQGGTPWYADYDIKVPAGKILVVFEINYSYSVYHYNEIIGTRPKTANIDARLQALENPDYVQENPLAVTKETPGYTAIFRKMGVIGGSMSSGAHSHRGTTGDGNLYEFSTLQFMARMCGSEGFNFSEGGMSARVWVNHTSRGGASPLFLNNACDFYLIQLGNNDYGIHRDTDPSYLLGTTADLTPTGGVYPDTFFGNMGAILQKIRDVQPRAYVFLSTFLRGYGNIPADFDYNQAIRDIVTYFSDPANRPSGDELHYYLIDYYTYGAPYSYYYSGVHEGTVRGDHPVATGYLFWAWQYCTYIDWLIKNNMDDFNDVAFVGTDMYDNP